MTQIEILRCALASSKPTALPKLAALKEEVRNKTIQQYCRWYFEEGLPDIVLDTDHTSLQWRILKYLKKKNWITDPEADLKMAWESAKQANAQQGRNAFLGGQGKEKGPIKNLRALFSQAEQWVCYQAAIDGAFSPPFTLQYFLDSAKKAFLAGKGEALINLMIRLRHNHKRKKGHLTFNPHTLVMSLMWVSPSLPFWLLPSRPIADFIRVALQDENPQPEKTIYSAIREAGLVRISRSASSNFYKAAADPERKKLFEDISQELDFDISKCLAGRPRGS